MQRVLSLVEPPILSYLRLYIHMQRILSLVEPPILSYLRLYIHMQRVLSLVEPPILSYLRLYLHMQRVLSLVEHKAMGVRRYRIYVISFLVPVVSKLLLANQHSLCLWSASYFWQTNIKSTTKRPAASKCSLR
jgi:hypothetical protein